MDTGPDDGNAMLEIVDKVLLRRQYFRDKKRAHRRKVAEACEAEEEEISRLQAIVDELERHSPTKAAANPSDGTSLSWSVVAGVFRANSSMSLASRRALHTQTTAHSVLAQTMEQFVLRNLSHTSPASWKQPATLMVHPEARKLGKEWLTQRMYNHTDAALRCFPDDLSADADFAHFDADVSDGGITICRVRQDIWPGSVDDFRTFFSHYAHFLLFRDPSNVVVEHSSNTMLYRRTEDGSLVNFLQGTFVEADRVVVVIRQIEADEAIAPASYRQQHHYMTWVEIRPLSPTHVTSRLLTVKSQHFFADGGGFIPLDEQAALWGVTLVDVPERDKMDALRRRVVRQEYADLAEGRQKFRDLFLHAKQQTQLS
ncbi:Aste57867_11433 [Aphanomyces stellatus]|uniref:Aste57867_11433 protein n=1 Tax=Aphanomyces stellatus TaxID=120398 RepID=A0A485KSZ7_9STRA|nr:hypothetical protein As57867_011391 [Aphanomyces stellatus]VFT88294.1 Aste57867_11433 [Aphanomyces stellatus]